MHDDAHSPKSLLTKIVFIFLCLYPILGRGDAQTSVAETERSLARANEFFENGEFGLALGLYDRLARLDPKQDIYWFNYASTLAKLERYPEAIEAYRRAIRLNGSLRNAAVFYLAETYRLQGDTPRARLAITWLLQRKNISKNLLEEALVLATRLDETLRSRDEFDELINQGIWRMKNKRYAEAYSYFNGALQIKRTQEAMFLLALAEVELGEVEKTERLLKEISTSTEDKEISQAADLILEGVQTLRKTRLYLNTESQAGLAVTSFDGVIRRYYETNNSIRVGYRLLELEEWMLSLRYRLNWRQQFSPLSNTLFTNTFGAGAAYDVEDWVAEVHLNFEVNNFTDEIFLYRSIVGWSVAHKWKPSRLLFGLDAIGSNVPKENYSYLNGKTAMAKLDWLYFWERGAFGLYSRYALDGLGDSTLGPDSVVPISNRKVEGGQTLRVGLGRYWTFKEGISIARKMYRKQSKPDDKQRRDIRFMANLGFEFRASIPWLLDFGLAYIDNHSRLSNSSVSDQNYREFQGRINLLWDFKP